MIQKVGQYLMSAVLSNPSGVPLIEGQKGRTGALEHVVSPPAVNAGSSKQECFLHDDGLFVIPKVGL